MSLYRRTTLLSDPSQLNITGTQSRRRSLRGQFKKPLALNNRNVIVQHNIKITSTGSDSDLRNRVRVDASIENDQLFETDGSNSQDTSLNDSQSVISIWSQEEIPYFGPPQNLTPRERLQWLQDRRDVGLYVMCDSCDKSRYLDDVKDPLELPEFWYCHMNPDKNFNNCSEPEVKLNAYEEEDLIYNMFTAGSIVWALVAGCPWWPGMVTDCPYTESYYELEGYSNIPVRYNVIFFWPTTYMSWLRPNRIRKFKGNEDDPKFRLTSRSVRKYDARYKEAVIEARSALNYDIAERLKRFSYLARTTDEPSERQKRRKKKRNSDDATIVDKEARLIRNIEKVNAYESKRKIIEIYRQYELSEEERIKRYSQ